MIQRKMRTKSKTSFEAGPLSSASFLSDQPAGPHCRRLSITIHNWALAGHLKGHAVRLLLETGPCPRTEPPPR